jgi:hypothetical protein
MSMAECRVSLDKSTFDPWAMSAVTHSLHGHPLLSIDALVELGQLLVARRLVRSHSDEVGAGRATGAFSAPDWCIGIGGSQQGSTVGAYMGINAGIKRISGRGARDNTLADAPTGKVPA